MGKICESTIQGNLSDRFFGFAQQLAGSFDAKAQNIFHRGTMKDLKKTMLETGFTQIHRPGQIVDADLLIQMTLNVAQNGFIQFK